MQVIEWLPIETTPPDTGEIFWIWADNWTSKMDPEDEAGSSVRDGFLENNNWHVLTWEGTRLCADYCGGYMPTHWARKVNPGTIKECGEFDLEDWVAEKYEKIAAKYDRAGAPIKGGSPIAYALRQAFAIGKACPDNETGFWAGTEDEENRLQLALTEATETAIHTIERLGARLRRSEDVPDGWIDAFYLCLTGYERQVMRALYPPAKEPSGDAGKVMDKLGGVVKEVLPSKEE